jgi:hypothetical protein
MAAFMQVDSTSQLDDIAFFFAHIYRLFTLAFGSRRPIAALAPMYNVRSPHHITAIFGVDFARFFGYF